MNTLRLTETIRDMAAKDYRKTEVSNNMGIGFSCNVNQTLNEACQEGEIRQEKLRTALEQIELIEKAADHDFTKWKLDVLIDYIINTHHQYAKTNAVIIYDLVQKVANQDSERHPELIKLSAKMFLFFHDLLNWMKKEEQILFPSIKQLIENKKHSEKFGYTTFGLIKEWVNLMYKEHQTASENLKSFHELTNHYRLPEDASFSHKYLFEKMKEFEADFLLHVFLENNILFPEALIEDQGLDENAIVNLKPEK
ncbi:MAG: hemerythrin domain-containing protein [Chitinophagaceae bacterium]|nr:hemerythrin domain-containing protein [Chitinophagaceae bacterium]